MTVPTSRTRFDPSSPAVLDALAEARVLSARRDADRLSPAESIRRLSELGLPAARVPVEHGGGGLTLTELFAFVADLAAADSNIAQSLRNHFLIVETMIRPDRLESSAEALEPVLDGKLIGSASSEPGATPAGQLTFDAKLIPDGDGFRLSGEKNYSTGNLFASLLFVTASTIDGSVAAIRMPADREGVEIPDDWDGMGQRLTGSGTTRFNDVRVERDEVTITERRLPSRPHEGTYPQLWLTTTIVGCMRAAVADMIDVVRSRRRNYYHGLADEPRNEPSVQETVGQALANTYAAEAIVGAAARQLEVAWSSNDKIDIDVDLAREASIAAANAKVVVDSLALTTATLIFDAGGATATLGSLGLDRHWRNIRTLASHNPSTYKRRVLGDHALNGTAIPSASYF